METISFGRRRTEPLAAAVQQSAPATSAPPQALADLRAQCMARLDPIAVSGLQPERLINEVNRLISEIATEHRIQLNGREQQGLADELVNDMLGLGPLELLLQDETISDIMVNGPNRVFVERGGKVTLTNTRFRDSQHLTNICQRIAAGVGRRVDESSPMVDARLKDGSRVNIVLPPLALDGPSISIRKFGKKTIDFARLIEFGAMTAPVAEVLQIAARSRLNVVISGGTGSGKTTLLNAMSRMIDAGERVITVEDAAELQLQQPHVVRLETRPPSLEGKGEVTQRDLVRNALRMRPDRIIIGEVRGAEAFDMLQAMNTGHDGSMSTIHANTTRDALTRIENMVQMGHMGLPSAAIRQQIAGAVDVIVQVSRQRDGGRRVTQVSEICGMETDVVVMNDIFLLEIEGERPDGRLSGRYKASPARPSFLSRLAYFDLDFGLDGGARRSTVMSNLAPSTLWLFGVGCLLLTGFCLSAYFLARSMETERRMRARMADVLQPVAQPRVPTHVRIARPEAVIRHGPARWGPALFGFDVETPERYRLPWWAVLLLTFIVARLGCELVGGLLGTAKLLLMPVIWIGLARFYFGWCEMKLRRQLLTQMPDALRMIVRSVRVGIPVTQAIGAVAAETELPTAAEFATLHRQLLIGISLPDALIELGRRTGVPEYRFFATAVSLQAQTGGGLSEVLENLADVIRQRVALQSRGYALSSEARTSAIVLSVMPVLTGAGLWLIDRPYIALLFNTPRGQSLLGAAVLLLSVGTIAMRTIINRTLGV